MPNKDAIRLTNRTARALRSSARRQRAVYRAAAAVLTAALAVVSVLLGLRWLIAVPTGVAVCVLLDAAILAAGQARYLSLTGQAICTEAAARQIHGEADASTRRQQALRDLAAVSADAADALRDAREDNDLCAQDDAPRPPLDGEDYPDLRPARPARAPRADDAPPAHRRRRQAGFQVIDNEQRAK